MYFREYSHSRFLIIDSNIKLRMIMEEYLKSYGAWFIDLAADGVEAIEKCQNGLFDVVICDYNLGAKNGQQVLEELRHRKILKHAALFIMMSADTTKDMVLGAIEYQPDAYISKPITRDALKQRIDSLLIDAEALYDIKYAIDCEQVDEAIYQCEQKIRKRSKYSSWCYKTQAMLFLQSERFDEARAVYDTVLSTRPLLWAKIGITRVDIAEEHYAAAEAALQEIIKQNSLCLIAYDLLAEVYELTNRKKAAQDVLFEAVSHSPRATQRNIHLGELCLANQDFDVATEAFRNAVEHGEQSVFQNASNYLNFARCLHETSTTLEPELKFSRSDEALNAIKHAEQRFTNDDEVSFQSNLIKARIHKSCDKKDEALSALTDAQQFYLMIASELSPDMTMEYAQTLFTLEKDQEADIVLNQLIALNSNDEALKKKIEALRDEPVSATNKAKAAELNKEGIKYFESEDFDKAIEVFQNALTFSPKHPALNLNLVQVLMKKMSGVQNITDMVQLCRQCLDRVSHIKEEHKQFKRYQFLINKLDKLTVACE